MSDDDFSIVYRGDSTQADLLKSILEGNGIQALLEDEVLGRMVPYAVGAVKVVVATSDVGRARGIVEHFVKSSTT